MTDKELILLFKKDSGMSEKEWKRFCARYAERDICAVVEHIKSVCAEADVSMTAHFRKYLRKEMKRVSAF